MPDDRRALIIWGSIDFAKWHAYDECTATDESIACAEKRKKRNMCLTDECEKNIEEYLSAAKKRHEALNCYYYSEPKSQN